MTLSMNVVVLLYLVASVCFIQALKGLSHPSTSRRGNAFGMVGMALAIATTLALIHKLAGEAAYTGYGWVLLGLLIGGTTGAVMAKRVEMTKMPELVAFMHSMIGLAAVFIAIAAATEPQAFQIVAKGVTEIPTGNRLELFLGAGIGAITFSGSVIAFGKLSGKSVTSSHTIIRKVVLSVLNACKQLFWLHLSSYLCLRNYEAKSKHDSCH